MATSPQVSNISNRIWSLCDVLLDAGVSTGDYLQQLTILLFLKMADEYAKPPYNRDLGIPAKYAWPTLVAQKGAELEAHYIEILEALGNKPGMLGMIFARAQNKIQTPALLKRVIDMIEETSWVGLNVDVKGEIYESLLERVASDTKSGAGQYFTPRPLIRAMVAALRPQPKKTIADPACGTGGFFLSAQDYLLRTYGDELGRDELAFLKKKTFTGWELVPETARVCVMNLFLHGIGDAGDTPPIHRDDSLLADSGMRFDYVLANPPFGRQSSYVVTAEESGAVSREALSYNRQDFWASTSNKQLNFVQHIRTMLKADGRAAVVVPDNVLFEGGAGETVRRKLLETTDLHTILRLPTGIFYAQGVKANVIFFDNKPASKDPQTKEVWIYDLRTNKHFTLKERKLADEDFAEFLAAYNPENRHKRKESERFKRFAYSEIIARDKVNLDIFWLKDDSVTDMENLPEPKVIAAEILEHLRAAVESFEEIEQELEPQN
ncbi:MAG TPA: class I SAM-dependent DNA methyltransferase [Candidatus Paceibacterota bacterium]|nr:class I SAM-dependent DNA methyltransferase [Candidatus Paceibacterota bacterium]